MRASARICGQCIYMDKRLIATDRIATHMRRRTRSRLLRSDRIASVVCATRAPLCRRHNSRRQCVLMRTELTCFM